MNWISVGWNNLKVTSVFLSGALLLFTQIGRMMNGISNTCLNTQVIHYHKKNYTIVIYCWSGAIRCELAWCETESLQSLQLQLLVLFFLRHPKACAFSPWKECLKDQALANFNRPNPNLENHLPSQGSKISSSFHGFIFYIPSGK